MPPCCTGRKTQTGVKAIRRAEEEPHALAEGEEFREASKEEDKLEDGHHGARKKPSTTAATRTVSKGRKTIRNNSRADQPHPSSVDG